MNEKKANPYKKKVSGAGGALPGDGKKVVVAMSGGVDSSVAAALLVEQGYDVVGVALQTTDYSKYLSDHKGGTCCSVQDMEDARRVAEKIGIPFYVVNTEKTFDNAVVNYFVNDYLQGRTPNPCVMCNSKVKFSHLYKRALDIGADYIATGHYARLSKEPELGYCLWRGADETKDQSYFLFNLTQSQLARTLFPVGHLKKADVRKKALEFNLPVAEKPDSQEICFVPGNNYAAFIESRVPPDLLKVGAIATVDGRPLGEHNGLYKYTVGQRKGLSEAIDRAAALGFNPEELCVVKLDAKKNRLIMGEKKLSHRWGLIATQVNWVVPPGLEKTRRVHVKIRHSAKLAEAEIRPLIDNGVEVRFLEPQAAVTPGQACVFYDGNLCLGGGWIDEPIDVEEARRPLTADALEAAVNAGSNAEAAG